VCILQLQQEISRVSPTLRSATRFSRLTHGWPAGGWFPNCLECRWPLRDPETRNEVFFASFYVLPTFPSVDPVRLSLRIVQHLSFLQYASLYFVSSAATSLAGRGPDLRSNDFRPPMHCSTVIGQPGFFPGCKGHSAHPVELVLG
jgi:hypothetical protein